MDRQVDHTINNLEHKLRSCLINLRGSWDDNLPIIEFAYNNCYHSNIQMAPYETLYRCRCRSPIGWFQVGEEALIRLDSVDDCTEKI